MSFRLLVCWAEQKWSLDRPRGSKHLRGACFWFHCLHPICSDLLLKLLLHVFWLFNQSTSGDSDSSINCSGYLACAHWFFFYTAWRVEFGGVRMDGGHAMKVASMKVAFCTIWGRRNRCLLPDRFALPSKLRIHSINGGWCWFISILLCQNLQLRWYL